MLTDCLRNNSSELMFKNSLFETSNQVEHFPWYGDLTLRKTNQVEQVSLIWRQLVYGNFLMLQV